MSDYSVREDIPREIDERLEAYPELIRKLLFYRGIETSADVEIFLHPDYERDTHDPFLLFDMEKAVERVLSAIKNNEKIVIYSDYDTDGIPGAVIFHDFFKKIGYENFENYIPHRIREGFGLNEEAVQEIADGGAKLIITIDCGITDVGSVDVANKNGVDVIITDHHEANGKKPKAYAIVNPKQGDCEYPNPYLCGAGVAFKFVQALIKKSDYEIKEGWDKWLLDMAGTATVADMVPLVGENRAFAHYGLVVLRKSRRPGLQKLLARLNVDQRYLTEDDIGFTISPRINAASRMGVPMDAFHLLSTDDEGKADELAKHLDKINNERKGHVASMVKEVRKRLDVLGDMKEVLVMGNVNWKPSLLGLVANNLVEEFNRPVFLWGREGAKHIKGSCRSEKEIDVVKLMEEARGVFLDVGGHAQSGGFSALPERVHEIEPALITAYKKLHKKSAKAPMMLVDAEIDIDDISWKMFDVIKQLAPFGEGNPKPLFLVRNAEIAGKRQFGKNNEHLSLALKKFNGDSIEAIRFFTQPDFFSQSLDVGAVVHIIGTLEKSTFRRKPELRLRIIAIV